jgi:hypothetical protein
MESLNKEDTSFEDFGYPEFEETNNSEDKTKEIQGNGVGIEEKPTMQKIWDPEQLIIDLEMTWKGYVKKGATWSPNGINAKARNEFITNTSNSIRSVINPTNMITKMGEEQLFFLLLEKNLEFAYSMLDEQSVDEDDYESMANQFDHVLETFVGIILSGHGSKILTQVYAGLYDPNDKESTASTPMAKILEEISGK